MAMRFSDRLKTSHLALALAILILHSPRGEADAIVAPLGYQTVVGNSNNLLPFSMDPDSRVQQVYAASNFATMSGPEYIDQIAFRLASYGAPFAAIIPSVQITLSTTELGPNALSPVFADNVGANVSVVYQGDLPIFSLPVPGNQAGSPSPFNIVINLQKPFLYDPSQGNLLLDITSHQADLVVAQNSYAPIMLDAVEGNPLTSRVYSYTGLSQYYPGQTVNQQQGIAESLGLITQFTTGGPDPIPQPPLPNVIPEPTPLALLGLVGAGLVVRFARASATLRKR